MLEHVGPPYFISPCSNLPCRWMANSSWKDRSSFPATLGRVNPSCQFTLGEYFPVNTHSWLKIHLFQLLWTTSINHSKSLSMRHLNQSEKNGWIFSKQSLFTSYYASFLLQTSQSPHLRRAPGPYGSAAALGVGIGLHQRSSPCFFGGVVFCWWYKKQDIINLNLSKCKFFFLTFIFGLWYLLIFLVV